MIQHRLGVPVHINEVSTDQLTDDEREVVNKVARNTRMDCWFCLDYDPYEDIDFVLDTENEASYDLREGLEQLMEAIDCIENLENCFLDLEEVLVLEKLMLRMGLCSLYDRIGG